MLRPLRHRRAPAPSPPRRAPDGPAPALPIALPVAFSVALPVALSVALSVAGPARAQNPGRPSLTPAPADEPDPALELDPDVGEAHPGIVRPAGADRLAGHLLPFGLGHATFLVGSLAEGRSAGELLGPGLGAGAGLAVGLSRYVAAYASAAYETYGGAAACEGCSAGVLSVGAGLAYRLVQGSALVPHASFGVGFVSLDLEGPGAGGAGAVAESYAGLDFARVGLGADFFPLPFLGFGPYAEANLGTYLRRPETDREARVSARLQVGLRLVLDVGGGMEDRRPGRNASGPSPGRSSSTRGAGPSVARSLQ